MVVFTTLEDADVKTVLNSPTRHPHLPEGPAHLAFQVSQKGDFKAGHLLPFESTTQFPHPPPVETGSPCLVKLSCPFPEKLSLL